ncbi:hypothetical protein NIES4071_103540 (plasmid) [Calothrix sp. NIES-4071]|nr:hypothetical protein NIES4071_103540 [Calothrix sp. NIES-4071]BAZ64341.1 hypothetical protein NIES4105_100740 [Calothrix sp. NIES-4105]
MSSNFIEVVDKVKELTGSNLTYAQFAAVFKEARTNSTLTKDRLEQLKEESKSLSDEKKLDILKGIGNYIKARGNQSISSNKNLASDYIEIQNNQIIAKTETKIKSQSPTQINTQSNVQSNTFEQDSKKQPDIVANIEAPSNIEGESVNEIYQESETNLQQPTDNEVKQYVIPVVADKIASYGKSDINRDSITYENDNFTAMLRLGDEEQRITLDRKNTSSPDIANALTASKGNKEQEYQIILNNLTRDEFDRFKVLFEKANQEKNNQNKEQRESKEEGLG